MYVCLCARMCVCACFVWVPAVIIHINGKDQRLKLFFFLNLHSSVVTYVLCLFIDRSQFKVFTQVVPLFCIVMPGEFSRRSVKKTGAQCLLAAWRYIVCSD